MQPHRGTIVLIFGILSLVVCGPLGIFAWVMGNTDLKAMHAGVMDPSGQSITQVGKVLGIIGSLLFIVSLVIIVIALILPAIAAAAN